MALTVQNGSLRLEGNALGTGQDCCCDSPPPPECESDEDCDGGYCCDGVCQEEPCDDCECPSRCGYELRTTIDELTTTAEAVFNPPNCEQLGIENCRGNDEDEEANPQDPGDQIGVGGTNFVRAQAGNDAPPGLGIYAFGGAQFEENYNYINGNSRRDYNRAGNAEVYVYCSFADGVAKWNVSVLCYYAEGETLYDTSTTPFTLVRIRGSSVSRFATIQVALQSCCVPPDITVVVDLDVVVINGTSYPMEDLGAPLSQNCTDFPDGVPTACGDFLSDYPAPTTFQMTWTGDCDGPCDVSPP